MQRLLVRFLGLGAHLVSLALAGLFLFFVFAEVFTPHSGPPTTWQEIGGIALITIACCAPAFAFHHEAASAAASLLALVAFSLLYSLDLWPVAAVIALPALLHLAHAWLEPPGGGLHHAS